jgi:hypothetical protein
MSDGTGIDLGPLTISHSYQDSVSWALTSDGLSIDGAPPRGSGGPVVTMRRIWDQYGASIAKWAAQYQIPVELIAATIATESGGKADAIRFEPGYVSDDETPNKVSPGLMQTLISTARAALGNDGIDRAWLLVADNAIQAGTAYMAQQRATTQLDPPKVACAYNAGGIYYQDGDANRWKMRQYPIGTSAHADRYVEWFNDCFTLFAASGDAPAMSFFQLLRQQAGS